MKLVYPRCPACGEVAYHRPVVVERGACRTLVQHTHPDCQVHRYIARVDRQGRQDNEALADGVEFEEVAL